MTENDTYDEADTEADVDLVLRSRSGDADAFGELWRRHYRSGIVVARSVSSDADPDDLVQEAYARIFQAIQRGGGPTGSFRAYLFTSIRNAAAAWGRSRNETPIDEFETLEDPDTTDDATLAALDRSLTHTAFRSLPTRWQEVLWYTEIEQLKPAEIAPLLGMKPVAVAQLAFRAREGLREAWIQAHLNSLVEGSDCRWAVEHLGAHTRGNLSARNRTRLDAHLEDCARCTIVASEAQDVGSRLALVLLPLAIGVSATATYLASLQRDDSAAIALAAMPAHLVEGAVVAGGGAVAAATSGGGAGGGSGSSSSSAWTVGGIVAAGAAAVAVAVAVVATALSAGGGSSSSPSEAGDGGAPAAAVEADPRLADAILPEDEPQDAPKKDPTPTPSPTPSPDAEPTPAASPAAPAPSSTPSTSPAPSAPPVAEEPAEEEPEQSDPAAAPIDVSDARIDPDTGEVVLDLQGEPNEPVQVFALSDAANGGSGGEPSTGVGVPLAVRMAAQTALADTILDGTGAGELRFTLTREQARADVTLEVSYLNHSGGVSTRRVSEYSGLKDQILAGAPIAFTSASPDKEGGTVALSLTGEPGDAADVTVGGTPAGTVTFDANGAAALTLTPEQHRFDDTTIITAAYRPDGPEGEPASATLKELPGGGDLWIDTPIGFGTPTRNGETVLLPLTGEPHTGARVTIDGGEVGEVRFDGAGTAHASFTPLPAQLGADSTVEVRYASPHATVGGSAGRFEQLGVLALYDVSFDHTASSCSPSGRIDIAVAGAPGTPFTVEIHRLPIYPALVLTGVIGPDGIGWVDTDWKKRFLSGIEWVDVTGYGAQTDGAFLGDLVSFPPCHP